jgi:hypothetical protein
MEVQLVAGFMKVVSEDILANFKFHDVQRVAAFMRVALHKTCRKFKI